jgi:hypothetical protein
MSPAGLVRVKGVKVEYHGWGFCVNPKWGFSSKTSPVQRHGDGNPAAGKEATDER